MTSSRTRRGALAAALIVPLLWIGRSAAQEAPRTTTVQVMPAGALAPSQTMGVIDDTGAGAIAGRVLDALDGRPLPGVVVTLGNTIPTPASRDTGSSMITLASMAAVSRGEASKSVAANDPDVQPLPRVITGVDGRFVFSGLPPGVFHLGAKRPGYFDGAFGRIRPDGGALPIPLGPDERVNDVTIRLFQPAAITGTVRDAAGDAVVGVTLRAWRRSVIAGRRVITPTDVSASTDDRGIYRLGHLVPGEYLVAMPTMQTSVPATFQLDGAAPALGATMTPFTAGSFVVGSGGTRVTPDGRFLLQDAGRTPGTMSLTSEGHVLVYPTTYYPAARALSQASPIVVSSGENRAGIDLQTAFVRTANISGRLQSPDGPAANYVLHLVPGDAGEISSDPDIAAAVTDANGDFQFLAVPSGQYVIQTVRTARGSSPPGTSVTFRNSGTMRGGGPPGGTSAATLWVASPVSVGTTDITDVALMLNGGVRVAGRVEFAGAGDAPKFDGAAPVFLTAEAADGRFRGSSSLARVDATGHFAVDGLVPGKYILRVLNAPAGWTAATAMLNGANVLDVPFDATDAPAVVVTLTDTSTALRGHITKTNGSPDDAAVAIVFPTDSRAWTNYGSNPRRIRMARSGRDGAFLFTGLPPGDYFAAAVSDEFAGQWQDPQFLDRIARQAARVTLHEGDQAGQDLVTQSIRPAAESAIAPAEADAATESLHGPCVDEQAAAAPADSASLSGLVTDAETKQPIRYARVAVSGPTLPFERTTATDEDGRFTVSSLPAGRFTVVAGKPAFLDAYNGASRPGRGPGVPVIVTDGQAVTGIALRLARGAVITGALRDDFGLPIPSTTVLVTEIKTINGGRVKGVQTRVESDDLGVYRAFGLAPGSYLIGVAPTPLTYSTVTVRQTATTPAQGRAVNYAPVYYPGTGASAAATLVTVIAGQEAANIDVPIHLVPSARIAGTAIGRDGTPVADATVTCMPADPDQIVGMLQTRALAAQDGSFVIANVPPGRYRLSFTPSSTFRAGTRELATIGAGMWALAEVDVNGQDINGFVLELQEGLTVAGRVAFAGATAPPPDPTKFGITLRALDPDRRNGVATADKAGNLFAKGLMPGRYRVEMSTPPGASSSPWRLRSAVIEGHDAADTPMEITPGHNVEGLVATFTDRATTLSGTLRTGTSTPAAGFTLMVFSTDRSAWTPGSRRVSAPLAVADDGTYAVTGLPAGEYYVAALLDVDPREAVTSPFLEQAAGVAMKVMLVEGQTTVQDLQIVK